MPNMLHVKLNFYQTVSSITSGITTIHPFEPTSYPLYPGIYGSASGWYSFQIEQEEIDLALTERRFEDAKLLIYNKYGNTSSQTIMQLAKVIDALVRLNKEPLSTEHFQANHTLDAAYNLGCHMYTVSTRQVKSGGRMIPNPLPNVVEHAILQVAGAYQEKGDTLKAIRAVRRLETTYGEEYTNRWIASVIGK